MDHPERTPLRREASWLLWFLLLALLASIAGFAVFLTTWFDL
jgi:hypothetical protein